MNKFLKLFDNKQNTLIYDTSNYQWNLYWKYGVFGTVEAKKFLGIYLNNGTVRGWMWKKFAFMTYFPVKRLCHMINSKDV
jgi:hypothetical protein